MLTSVLEMLGLARNEARIYETLLREGEASAGRIATKSHVHRRNVYDSLKGLIKRGLVFEVPGRNETTYRGVEPDELLELVQRKKQALGEVLPGLEKLYTERSPQLEVHVYRGPEGWKNYMRDMVKVGGEAFFIAAKGGWLDERVQYFFPEFMERAVRKRMRFFHLFDAEVKKEFPGIIPHVGTDYRFLPKGYSTTGAIDIFGDHVNFIPEMTLGKLGEEMRLTVIVNRQIAEAYRHWFWLLWNICPEEKSRVGRSGRSASKKSK